MDICFQQQKTEPLYQIYVQLILELFKVSKFEFFSK
jgi:hypothetical protein